MESVLRRTVQRVDVLNGQIEPVRLEIQAGRIAAIEPVEAASDFALPGFVDAHIHIESSMVSPGEFARIAVRHGTVATVSDPHEIANVCGIAGIELMLDNASTSPLKFHFGAPSCVPATQLETAGAAIDAQAVDALLNHPQINHLSEVMNYRGVLEGDEQVIAKIKAAHRRGLPVDGHGPGLRGDEARRYIQAGITTDHECVSLAEAEHKIACGARIAIREGSAARNFDELWPLIDRYPQATMLCSDDKHPDDLLEGHINQLVTRALQNGCDLMNTLRAATVNAVEHYGLDVGLLRVGDPADFIVVSDLEELQVRETYIDGRLVAHNGESLIETTPPRRLNRFDAIRIPPESLQVPAENKPIRVIEVHDGQLVTGQSKVTVEPQNGMIVSSPTVDLLKLSVVNRYREAAPSIGFVRGFGLQEGALASSVAHDSHNIVAVGTSDQDLLAVINSLIDSTGGLALSRDGTVEVLPLPIAGLMSDKSCEMVGKRYRELDRAAKLLGCVLSSPFMTLSFLALPVIPSLKLTDRGLFDVNEFQYVSLF